MFIVMEGRVAVRVGHRRVGTVHPGESLGEVALLTEEPHSATALAAEEVLAATLSRADLLQLTRQRPDIGGVLYRNLAIGLGRKLRRLDRSLAADES